MGGCALPKMEYDEQGRRLSGKYAGMTDKEMKKIFNDNNNAKKSEAQKERNRIRVRENERNKKLVASERIALRAKKLNYERQMREEQRVMEAEAIEYIGAHTKPFPAKCPQCKKRYQSRDYTYTGRGRLAWLFCGECKKLFNKVPRIPDWEKEFAVA